MQKMYRIALGFALLAATACNANSDASRIIESENISNRATISYYEGIAPTMTAQAGGMATRIAQMEATLGAVQAENRELTARLNQRDPSSTQAPGVISNVPTQEFGSPGTGSTPENTDAGNNTSATGVAFESIVTAKGKNNSGCAVDQTATFSTTDVEIYVVADVVNFERNTTFTASWSGADFERTDDWTSDYAADRECIYFYIEPGTLGLAPGTYTVTFSAGDLIGTPVEFTLE